MRSVCLIYLLWLMVGIQPAIGATQDPSHLVFGNVWMEGSKTTQLTQRLYVEVTNTGTVDYATDYWTMYNAATNQDIWDENIGSSFHAGERIEVKAGETKYVLIDFRFGKTGHFDICAKGGDDASASLFTFSVDIAEYQKPRIKTKLHVDMMEQTDEGNFVYGNLQKFRITGTATVTNEEDYTLFPAFMLIPGSNGASVYVFPTNYYAYLGMIDSEGWTNITSVLYGRQTVTVPFEYEFKTNINELIETIPDLQGNFYVSIHSDWTDDLAWIRFKPKESMLTYWTADGEVKPLTVGNESVISVPQDAAAVDLRGVYSVNTVFTVDPSEANPNCLYFVSGLDYVRGLENVQCVRDNETVMLIIDDGQPFYTPMPFKARVAQYMFQPHRENGTTDTSETPYSETMVLPFSAERVLHYDINGNLFGETGFNDNNLHIGRYVGHDGWTAKFQRIISGALKAYEPYLLTNMTASRLNFLAGNATIPSTREAVTQGQEIDFVGTTKSMDMLSSKHLLWNRDDQYFYSSPTATQLPPYRCYMNYKAGDIDEGQVLHYSFIEDSPGGGGDTGIKDVEESTHNLSQQASSIVYDLSGRVVADGRSDLQSLPRGLYIVGGKKVLVK